MQAPGCQQSEENKEIKSYMENSDDYLAGNHLHYVKDNITSNLESAINGNMTFYSI